MLLERCGRIKGLRQCAEIIMGVLKERSAVIKVFLVEHLENVFPKHKRFEGMFFESTVLKIFWQC